MLAPLNNGLLLNPLGADPIFIATGEGRPMIKAWTEGHVASPRVLQYTPVVGVPVGVSDQRIQDEVSSKNVECWPIGVVGTHRTSRALEGLANGANRMAAT